MLGIGIAMIVRPGSAIVVIPWSGDTGHGICLGQEPAEDKSSTSKTGIKGRQIELGGN